MISNGTIIDQIAQAEMEEEIAAEISRKKTVKIICICIAIVLAIVAVAVAIRYLSKNKKVKAKIDRTKRKLAGFFGKISNKLAGEASKELTFEDIA